MWLVCCVEIDKLRQHLAVLLHPTLAANPSLAHLTNTVVIMNATSATWKAR